MRSDNPSFLTTKGWADLHDYGIRTIVALRTNGTTDDEPDERLVPSDVVIERVAIEDLNDPAFVERCVDTGRWCPPIYFREMLEHCVAAVSAVAHAGRVVSSSHAGAAATGQVLPRFCFSGSSVSQRAISHRIGS